MNKNRRSKRFFGGNTDFLDKLVENEEIDEMGLLDLVFIEEILKPKIAKETV